jgi:hypothetical protein
VTLAGEPASWNCHLSVAGGSSFHADHVLVRVDRAANEVADCYCLDDARRGIDPEEGVRLMLPGLLSEIVNGRTLMRLIGSPKWTRFL